MKKLVAIILLAVCCFSVFSVPVSKVLPAFDEKKIKLLLEGTPISASASSVKNQDLKAIVPELSMIYSQVCSAENHDNSYEIGYMTFVKYPQSWENLSESEKQLKVYNYLLEISSQKGLKYESRGKTKTFIKDSYCIADESSVNKALPDPHVLEVPIINNLTIYQEDNRFGGNVYNVNYLCKDNEILMLISNKTKLKYLGVTAADIDEIAFYVDVYLTDEGILISSIAEVFNQKPKLDLLVYKVDISESFERRISALCNWFLNKVE